MVAFSPDGATLASYDYDTTLRLWAIETGAQLGIVDDRVDDPQSLLSEHNISFTMLQTETDHRISPYDQNEKKDWITKDGINILWLPKERRSYVFAAYGGHLALGLGSGKVLFFEFDPSVAPLENYVSRKRCRNASDAKRHRTQGGIEDDNRRLAIR